MASASSSSTSAPIPQKYKYDVFLSFRGEDTRQSFTDHLYDALCRAGIWTFRDDDEIREGEELKPEIERSIRDSRVSIIVFSKNFANSKWCLDEVCLILDQRRKGTHFVLPVFYGVDPSDVRNQRGSFSIDTKEGTKWTEENVKRWKAALTEVANLKGSDVSSNETTFIPNIVEKVYSQLGLELYTTPTGLTGIKTRAEGINYWLYEDSDSPVLAICGMGGSGKTTLAKHICSSNKHNFESSSFLEDIENKSGVLLGLQKQLLRDISGNNSTMISKVHEGALQVEKAIQMNRVLIVVDDIDDKDTLITLFGTKVFPTQSKIIITTRLLNIDTWFGSISCGCHVHKIELLNENESLELLSCHAFGSKIPIEGFEDLAVQLSHYCEGNPLALKVLGSSLPVKAQDQMTKDNMIKVWTSRINSLSSLEGDLDCKIEGVLHKSFETLPCNSHRELFLHIACLFIDESVVEVVTILEDEYHAESGITTLINRCLVTKPDGLRLTMHKLLRDMASKIVREESKDPAKRSRVWNKDDCYRLLRKGHGSETIEGLSVDMEEAEQGITSDVFKTSSLVKMKNLKLLQLNYVKLIGSYENFPDLRWLRWLGCYLKTIPTGLLTGYLVALYITFGDLEEFDPPMVLNSLKILDLSYSVKLVSICDLHRLPKLQTLKLDHCTSLTHECKTIGDLENLSCLSLSGCSKLWKASSNQMVANQPERLKDLCHSGGIPEQPLCSIPQSLSTLYLNGNPFEILPCNIDLEMLLTLDLSSCPNLKSLPCLPSTLQMLVVDWCSSLENITFQSGQFTLKEFNYEGCFKLCEIQGLFKLVSIEKLDEADLGNMQWIKAYQDHKVDLVGDVITKGRTFNIQMLYEYGIKSTYLQGIKDQSMATHQYTSSSWFLPFHVPLHPKKRRIKGLNVTILYKSSSSEDRDTWPPLFACISNRTKGVTWVYNPVVYCKPMVDKEVVWLSYWPIGNSLDAGDEVYVELIAEQRTIIRTGFGASVVYMEDGEVEKEEKCHEERMKKEEEVIGGDLSRLEVTKGGYYLCRRDFYNSMIPDWCFGDNIQITDSRRWRRCYPHTRPIYEFNFFRKPERHEVEILEHLKIPLEDILLATENFNRKYCIGSGGYGEVYKAELNHFDTRKLLAIKMKSEVELPQIPNTVAIKRIFSREDGQGTQGFLAELDVLSRCEHPNIVSLLGYCVEGSEMLLVYEHASKGSLDNYLESTDKVVNLTWSQRLKMCIDIAQGLNYLHTNMAHKSRIIHRDIKSANILLGENWEAKIADFGLSKSFPVNHQASTINTNNIAGTYVYLDPEYDKTGSLKRASDIYSFGVVLFEIFTGKLAYDPIYMKGKRRGLAPIAKRHFEMGTLINEMLDLKTLDDEVYELGLTKKIRPDHDSLDAFSRIAYQCLAKSQAERPTIKVVIKGLNKALNFQENQMKTLRVSLEDIKVGVENFSDDNCIMRGGYGLLYKGKVQYNNRHKEVVVKRFSRSGQDDNFLKEFEALFKFRHENIIGLVGYCKEMGEKIIVYEHASKGCLSRYLNHSSFTWSTRLKICIDIANGLKFLHEGDVGKDVVIHRDIKSSNILLTEDWKAKIFGFEHSLTYPTNKEMDYVITGVVGSPGYGDPLYWKTHFLTKESDIYSFGVILFEILCGRLACPEDFKDSSQFLDVLVKQHFQVARVDEIVFEGIKEQIVLESLATFRRIAFLCLHEEKEERPTAGEVVVHLQKALEFQEAYEIWEAKLPRNYKEILRFSKSPKIYSTMMKKDIHNILSEGILLKDDILWFSISDSGERNEMISARMFSFKNRWSHKWRSIQESRFPKVAEMLDISNLNIQIKIRPQLLPPDVKYSVHLVYKFLGPSKSHAKRMYVNLKYKMGNENQHAYFATRREDNWMKIELCRLSNQKKDTSFEVLLEGFSRCYCDSRAIYIEGIEFRAIENVKQEKMEKLEEIQHVLKSRSKMKIKQDQMLWYPLSKMKRKVYHMESAKWVVYDFSNVTRSNSKLSAQSRGEWIYKVPRRSVFCIKWNINEYHMVSSHTESACYLVFKLSENCVGLHCPVIVRDQFHWKSKHIVYLRSPSPWNLHHTDHVPKKRRDGWMEVIVSKFNSEFVIEKGCLLGNLKFVCYEGTMSGLIIRGLEFRPILEE